MSKDELLAQLHDCGIALNEAARALFAHEGFSVARATSACATMEVSVAGLGYAQGAAIGTIHERADELGLSPCPLELGPHLRLQFLDQPEGAAGQPSRHRAPPGSITIVSRPLTGDDDAPKGFYLRRIDGVLWLRGYWSNAGHVWSPEDRLFFCLVDQESQDRLGAR